MIAAAVLETAGAVSASTYIRGIVRDAETLQGLPYASVSAQPSGVSAVADSRGIFEFNIPAGTDSLTASCQGYAPQTVAVRPTSHNLYDIALSVQAQELKEVVVRKGKYSKKNNPAVEFAQSIRCARDLTDPRRNDWYSYDKYERIALGLNDFDTTASSVLLRQYPLLIEHVDSSEIDGKPVLNLSLKETATTELWRREGATARTVERGFRSNGIDEIADAKNVMTALHELFREVDLYDNDIKLLQNTFVSPLSVIAPDFYRFYLVDSAAVIPGSDERHIALAFYPRNKSSFGFTGHVYVPVGDTTMFIRRVEMAVPKEINLNFIRTLNIRQTFDKAPDGSRLKTSDDLMMVFSLVPGTPEFYTTRRSSFRNHSFERPTDADSIFDALGAVHVEADAANRDTDFWLGERVAPTPEGEDRAHLLMSRLRTKPFFYWSEKVLRILFQGYVGTGRDSRFDIGPVNTFASYNSLEGLRLRAGGMTTANLSPHWFGRGYVAYGFRDRKWKYSAEAEYSFNAKDYHSREFPVHSLRLTHRYDIDRLGSHYLYTNADNFVLSLSRMSDAQFSYRRDTRLEYTLELANHFSMALKAEHIRQEPSKYLQFVTGSGRRLGHFDEVVFEAQLRYAPGEKFFQSKSFRIQADKDVPVFMLSHRYAPARFCGSDYGFNRTEFSFAKRFRLSILGALTTQLDMGHVWSTAPFTELLIPNANLSYTIQPGSFALMNPMEFINSTYVSLHASWNLRGALFNLIPGLKRLGLREVVSFSGMWGRLTDRNRPGPDSDLPVFPQDAARVSMHVPYMEVSAGLDNILRILRIDYVRRLNYLNVPYPIDRQGVRVALHFSF